MQRNEFEPQNFEKVELKFNFILENLYFLLFMGLALVVIVPYNLIWSTSFEEFFDATGLFSQGGGFFVGDNASLQRLITYLVVFVIGVVIHELIHGLFYARYMKNGFKSVKIGFKFPFAYAESKEVMRTDQFIIGLVMPMIILGVIPSIIATIISNPFVMLFGYAFIVAGSGDTLILLRIFKNRKSTWFENLPSINKWYVYKPIKK
jgi:hypothetical protein